MPLMYPLVFAAFLFSAGVYGVLARRNAVMVLMSIELMLNAVNVNLIAFNAFLGDKLVVALASVAGVYLLLAAPFVAFVQVIIYVGAIVVLILFGIMLTRAPVGRRVLDNTLRARVGAFVVGAGVFVMLTVFLAGAFGDARIATQAATATTALGESLFRNYVLPFEAVSLLLLAALIGAIVLSRRD